MNNAALGKKTILVVEDDRPLSHALELKLSHAGYKVKTASDGKAAIEILSGESFSLILLDLVMPEVDGFKVLEIIREKKITTPVIVLSNLGQEEDEAKAKGLGAKEFFVKSNTPIATIVEHVKAVLD